MKAARLAPELGKLADLTGDHRAACQEYHLAVQLAKVADDSIGLAEVERLLATPYREARADVFSRGFASQQARDKRAIRAAQGRLPGTTIQHP